MQNSPTSPTSPTTCSRARSAGFTLLETVIALAIAAVGLGFLMSAAGTGLGNAQLADRYVEATRRAQSHLAEIGVTAPLVAGIRSGDDGSGFTWTTRVSAPVTHPSSGTRAEAPALGVYAVEISISWGNGVSVRDVTLYSRRIGRL